jgi:hypothetical protein
MFKSALWDAAIRFNQSRNRQARLAVCISMDRLYLAIIFGGIILFVTALALSAPDGSRNGRADDIVVLYAPRR